MKALAFLPRSTLRRRVEKALCGPRFDVEMAASTEVCLQFAQVAHYEAILVDADPPNFGDVLTLAKLLRQANQKTSLFLFGRYLDLEQRLRLFEVGADDCVDESFFAPELAVRLDHSVRLRQAASVPASNNILLRSGDLELDLLRRTVVRSGKEIKLRLREFLLLEYLVRNVNRPVTRTMILEQVWNSSFEGLSNLVDVHIHALRSKVDQDFPEKMIQTNRGIGYTFTCVNGFSPIPTGRARMRCDVAGLA